MYVMELHTGLTLSKFIVFFLAPTVGSLVEIVLDIIWISFPELLL